MPPELSAQIFAELHAIARSKMASQKVGHTLQATALVSEVYLKIQGAQAAVQDREHLVRLAARAMRQILVDHSRSKMASSRLPSHLRLDSVDALETAARHFQKQQGGLLGLDQALAGLEERDPELVVLVELRSFGGLSLEECSSELGIPLRTVERRWRAAKGILRLELERMGCAPPPEFVNDLPSDGPDLG